MSVRGDPVAERFVAHRCALGGAQAVEAVSRRSFPRHAHDEFGLGVIDRGAHRSWSGRGQVEASEGQVITCNPGEVHDGAPVAGEPRAWRILYLDPAVVAQLMLDISEGRSARLELPHPVVGRPALARLVRALFAAATADAGRAGDLARECLLLASLAGAARETDAVVPAPAMPAAVGRARARLDDAPAEPVSLAELARDAGVSRFQLLRAFVRATGLSPHAYLRQRRLRLARGLIAGGAALAEAAAASGFADQSHMTRAFRAAYGLTPGALARAVG